MTTSVTMPQMGETVLEGTIVKWLKKEGEQVAADEPLFEISTDKVDTEVPSPESGVLVRILVKEGETVEVGTELAVIEEPDLARPQDAAPAAPAGDEETAPAKTSGTEEIAAGRQRSQILSPLVRKLVEGHGIDLSQVEGSGSGGRITKNDIEAYLARSGTPPAARKGRPTPRVVPAATDEREEIVPVSHIRKAIARHMHESLQVSARAWNMVEVDIERVEQLREKAKEAFRAKEGFGLTYMPFLAKAVCDALLRHPEVNSELRDDSLVVRHYVNLGIAVSYEDGLIVPVVKDADSMSLMELARAVNDVAVRARAKKLDPDDVHGGTFTITNPGPFGSLMSVPIINQPQSAILAFDSVEKRPVVVGDTVAIRHMVYLSLSWDHRVIDGALASQFLSRVKEDLETWDFAPDLGP